MWRKKVKPIKFVTSFSKEGAEKYGNRMVESFLKHWPGDIHVYMEEPPETQGDGRIHYHNLMEVPGCPETIAALSVLPMTQGRPWPNQPRNYRFDACKFVRKVFAQADAATGYEGLLFWIDADVIIEGDMTENEFRMMFEDGEMMLYMNRPKWDHSCASFVGWDMDHEQAPKFWESYFGMIVSGRFLLLPQWHDSFWLDVVREQGGFSAKDLAADLTLEDGPANVFDEVFKGKAKHLKGNIKKGPQRYSQLIDIVEKKQPRFVAEIGTWNGLRALEMASVCKEPMEYLGFDLFEEATPETDEHEKNVKPHFTIDQVGKMLQENGLTSELVRGNTNETMPRWIQDNPKKKADLIYIDGGHAVETIRSDFDNALKMIKKGGVIVFDDVYEDMPGEELLKWGANVVLEESGLDYEILPIADPVKGGGKTKLAVVQC